jgi:hypothetical protein
MHVYVQPGWTEYNRYIKKSHTTSQVKKKNGGITIFNTHTIINENQQQHVQILPLLESWRLCSTSPSHHASLMQEKILIDAAALGAVPPRQRG